MKSPKPVLENTLTIDSFHESVISIMFSQAALLAEPTFSLKSNYIVSTAAVLHAVFN